MLIRLLIGVLALGVSDQSHNWQNTEKSAIATEEVLFAQVDIVQIQDSAKLHVGMLTVSLIVCLGYGGFVVWSYRTEKNEFLGHIRNLIIALLCRIFFTILFDGVIILGSGSSSGGNTLLALECISQNLVIAFWLILTVYLHERVQRKFKSEPSLALYKFCIPGVAVFFAFVWIFAMQAGTSQIWLFYPPPLSQWIVASLRLLYLLIQLGIIFNMGRIMMKISLDNDSISLLRKSVAILFVLVFLFWLQFGLSLERLGVNTTQSYQNFDYFIDGSQGALVCLALFFFYTWVSTFLDKIPSIVTGNEETTIQTVEVLSTRSQGIMTVDGVLTKKEDRRRKNSNASMESRDVVYSSIVEPHRLQKTLELYKRLNVLPSSQVTVFQEEEFFECQTRVSVSEIGDSEKADFRSVISEDSKSQQFPQRTSSIIKINKANENTQKKNAFYASKYLILDSKKNNTPNCQEARSCTLSSERESLKDDISKKEFFSNLDTLKSHELVKKWLNDHSENLQVKTKTEIEEHPTSTAEKMGNSNQLNTTTNASTSTIQKAAHDVNKDYTQNSDNDSSPNIQRKSSATSESTLSKANHRGAEIISLELEELKRESNNVTNEKEQMKNYLPIEESNRTKRLNESFENIAESISNEKDVTKIKRSPEDVFSFGKTDCHEEYETDAAPSAFGDEFAPRENSNEPFNLENLKLAQEMEVTQNEVKLLEKEQTSRDLLRNKEETHSSVIRQMKESKEPQLEHSIAVSKNPVTKKEEPSSESDFSIERTQSSTSSISIDTYYARLRNNEEKIHSHNHPFSSAKKKRPKLK